MPAGGSHARADSTVKMTTNEAAQGHIYLSIYLYRHYIHLMQRVPSAHASLSSHATDDAIHSKIITARVIWRQCVRCTLQRQ